MAGEMKLMLPDRVRQHIDEQIEKLARVRFKIDPLLGQYSELTSICASAVKRHGQMIELAIIEALAQNSDYRIWRKTYFNIPEAADHVVQSQSADECSAISLPYVGTGRKLQIDLLAYSYSRRRLGAYEIKRAHSPHDAGKMRSLRRDVFATQIVIQSFGKSGLHLPIDEAIARGIFYYGRRSLPPAWSLIGAQLDEHFGFGVRTIVEDCTNYYRARLESFMQGIDEFRSEIRQLALL
jgi:hypothetical protein